MDAQASQPWFAGVSVAVLLFKVNRRPRPQNLFTEQPTDVLDHFTEVLLFGDPVVTGRKTRRTWLLGNREISLQNKMLSGQIGWERHDDATTDAYDVQEQRWIDVVEIKGRSARSVFVFDAYSRYLAVVRHPSFSDTVLPKVFCELLNRGETAREATTTDWDVEPVLDEAGFREWLAATQAVEKVRFVAKLPNPGGLDAFQDVWQRLERLKASKIEENIEASDPEVGLSDLMADPLSAQFIAMAGKAYGYITAVGANDGRTTKYDQRKKVKREYVTLVENWMGLVQGVKDLLRKQGGERK